MGKVFTEVYSEFEKKNRKWLKNELPSLSMVKQDRKIDGITDKMIMETRKFIDKDFRQLKKDKSDPNLMISQYENMLKDIVMDELENILKGYVETESNTHWVDQTQTFFDNLFRDGQEKKKKKQLEKEKEKQQETEQYVNIPSA